MTTEKCGVTIHSDMTIHPIDCGGYSYAPMSKLWLWVQKTFVIECFKTFVRQHLKPLALNV